MENTIRVLKVEPGKAPYVKEIVDDYKVSAVINTGIAGSLRNEINIGDIVLSGPGAGEFPTASSVIGDILAIAREWKTTDYLLPMMRCHHHSVANPIKMDDTLNKYYFCNIRKNY